MIEINKIVIADRASAILFKFLMACNIGGLFILPTNICPIVPHIFRFAKVKFEFIDINTTDYCVDYHEVVRKVSNEPWKYSGILFNHTYGFEITPTTFFNALKKNNADFLIIDDKCLCKPAISTDFSADLTLFSTGHSKFLDLNMGGIGIIKSEKLLSTFNDVMLSRNFYFNDTNVKLNKSEYLKLIERELERIEEHKKKINNIYNYYLTNFVKLEEEWNNWRFNILVEENSDLLLKKIFSSGHFASKHYCPLGFSFYPNAQELYTKVINLFNDKHITYEKAEELAKYLKSIHTT